jgi:hypothetical protein
MKALSILLWHGGSGRQAAFQSAPTRSAAWAAAWAVWTEPARLAITKTTNQGSSLDSKAGKNQYGRESAFRLLPKKN